MSFTGCRTSRAYASRSTLGFPPRNRRKKVTRWTLRCGVWRNTARWRAGQSRADTVRKVIPDAPHEVLLILDGSTGQNAFVQAKEFSRATDVTSLAVTKLDGSAKGGVVIGIVDQFRIPIKFIGIGEGIDDLKVFDRKEFVTSLFTPEDLKK